MGPSDTVQIATAVISLVGTMVAGLLTYFMARLKSDEEKRGEAQQLHATKVTGKVEEIQDALRRIEDNRANLAFMKDTLAEHGMELVAHAHATAEELAAAHPEDIRRVIEHYGRNIVATTQATVAKLAAMDTTEPETKEDEED